MDKQQFLKKFEELKKNDAKPELWRFLKLWLRDGKSKLEIAKIIRKKANPKNPDDVTIVSHRLKSICEHFGIKVEGRGTHEAELVYLFRTYVPDLVHPNVCPDAVDINIVKRSQSPTNYPNIPTDISIDKEQELRSHNSIGQDETRVKFSRSNTILKIQESRDSTSSEIHPTCINADAIEDTNWGYCFNGEDRFLDIEPINLDLSNSGFTLAAWVCAEKDQRDHRSILSKGKKPLTEKSYGPKDIENGGSHIEIYIEGIRDKRHIENDCYEFASCEFSLGEFRLYMPAIDRNEEDAQTDKTFHPGDFGSGFIIDDNFAHYLVITVTDNEVIFFVDFEEGRKHRYIGSINNCKETICIGKQTDRGDTKMFFNGKIYMIAIHKWILTDLEINRLHSSFLAETSMKVSAGDFQGAIKTLKHPKYFR